MSQKKLFDYKDNIKPDWVIEQLKNIGMTYTEMSNRMKVNKSTLYRFRKGTHRSPKMKKKIIDMFLNPYRGVVIFYHEGYGSPFFKGAVYSVVYNEADLHRQINFDKADDGVVKFSKFIKRFTSAMVLKHQEIALELVELYKAPFKNLNQWLIEQVLLMKTQKTRDKTLNLLQIDYLDEI